MPLPRCSANWPKIWRSITTPGLDASSVTAIEASAAWAATGSIMAAAIAAAEVRRRIDSIPCGLSRHCQADVLCSLERNDFKWKQSFRSKFLFCRGVLAKNRLHFLATPNYVSRIALIGRRRRYRYAGIGLDDGLHRAIRVVL